MSTTVEQAEAALKAAEAEYDSEMERDSLRGDGSSVSEGRRHDRQQSLLRRIETFKRELANAKAAENAR